MRWLGTALLALAVIAAPAPAHAAMFFDGVNDSLNYGEQGQLGQLDDGAAHTVCFSLRINAVKSHYLVAKSTSAAGNGFSIVTGTGAQDDLAWITGNQSGRIVNGAQADGTTNRWCFAYDGSGTGNVGRLRIYRNGVYETPTFSGTIPADIGDPGACSLCVGAGGVECALAGSFASASISQVRIWTVALNSDEIALERFSYWPPVRLERLVLWAPLDNPEATNFAGEGQSEPLPEVTGAVLTPDADVGDPAISGGHP